MQEGRPSKEIWIVLLVSALLAVLNVTYLWTQIWNPSDNTSPESQTAYNANRVAHGESIYLDYHRPPYNIAPYTPGYYLVLGMLVRYLNAAVESIFPLGRGISFFCCLLISLFLYLNSRFDGDHPAYSLTAGFLFLSSHILSLWGATTRPDLFTMSITIAGVLIYLRFSDNRAVLFSAPFFVLAFFAKQTALSAPIAGFLHLLFEKKWKNAFLFAAAVGGSVIAIFSVMHVSTAGLSTMNIVYGNVAPMGFQNFRVLAGPFFQVAALPLILATAGVLSGSYRSFKSLYFMIAVAQGLITCSRLGSNQNYFIEPVAASCLLIAPGFRTLEDHLKSRLRPLLLVLTIVLLFPAILVMAHSVRDVQFPEDQSIRKLVLEADGLVITDNSRLALLGRDSFLIEPFQLSYMEKAGKWSAQGLVEMLHRHEIQYVVLMRPIEQPLTWQGMKRLPDGVIDAVKSAYRFSRLVDNHYVYVPRR